MSEYKKLPQRLILNLKRRMLAELGLFSVTDEKRKQIEAILNRIIYLPPGLLAKLEREVKTSILLSEAKPNGLTVVPTDAQLKPISYIKWVSVEAALNALLEEGKA